MAWCTRSPFQSSILTLSYCQCGVLHIISVFRVDLVQVPPKKPASKWINYAIFSLV